MIQWQVKSLFEDPNPNVVYHDDGIIVAWCFGGVSVKVNRSYTCRPKALCT